jgi:RHS repeat-associated protein
MLAYSILLTGGVMESLAYGAGIYENLQLSVWGSHGKTISYTYDDNGSLTSKTTRQDGVITEVVEYVYDLQGRLASAATTPYYGGSPETPTIAAYGYNEGGIRTRKTEGDVTTTYLVDSHNPTGYAQVLEETTGGTIATYIIGDDVIAQHTAADGFEYLLYDGHGSTRQLVDSAGNIVDSYGYDAYGVQTSGGSETSLRYCGEQYDSSLSQYYLRARYYDQSNGRFTSLDPYSGNTSDPQSLHKYTYCHSDPMNRLDPTGRFSLGEQLCSISLVNILVGLLIGAAVLAIVAGPVIYNYRVTGVASLKVVTAVPGQAVRHTAYYRLRAVADFVSAIQDANSAGEKIVFFRYCGHGLGDETPFGRSQRGWGLMIGCNDEALVTQYLPGGKNAPDNAGLVSFGDIQNLVVATFDSVARIELQACYSAFGPDSIAHSFKQALPGASVWGYTGPAWPVPVVGIDGSFASPTRASEWVEVQK